MSLYEDMPMIQGGGGYYCFKDVRLHFGVDCIFVEKVKIQFLKYKTLFLIINFFSITNGNLIHVP